MNRQHSWADWIKEGLIDGVTIRNEGVESLHYQQLRQVANQYNLPLTLNRRHWCDYPGENWVENQGRMAGAAIDAGIDGFMFYENYDIFRLGDEPGMIRPTVSGFREMIENIRKI